MERQRVIDTFVDEMVATIHPDDPERAAAMRAWLPAELPPAPSAEQIEAWVELGELAADPAVRRCLRAVEGEVGQGPVLEWAGAAVRDGVDPASARGRVIAAAIAGDLPPQRWAELATRVERYCDERFERYWALLMILNGQQPVAPAAPLFAWLAAALRAAA
ncbi:hypothetical protein OHA21_21380 [Actinoplanes sp. NBC_00393]|uniref:hypothetical protein n=1 Tax=Actinoplanes sp. NBC_00393 TaxID=2975953 RepID=UPI002E1A4538